MNGVDSCCLPRGSTGRASGTRGEGGVSSGGDTASDDVVGDVLPAVSGCSQRDFLDYGRRGRPPSSVERHTSSRSDSSGPGAWHRRAESGRYSVSIFRGRPCSSSFSSLVGVSWRQARSTSVTLDLVANRLPTGVDLTRQFLESAPVWTSDVIGSTHLPRQ